MIKHMFLLLIFVVGFITNVTAENFDEPVLQFMPPKATTLVKVGVNLDAGDSITDITPFDFENQECYSFSVTDTVYDSFGLSHTLQLFFIRRRQLDWSVVVMIDGSDVGAEINGFTTQAVFYLEFYPTGELAQDKSKEIVVERWTPRDRQGNPNGAVSTTPLKIDVSACTLLAAGYVERYMLQNGYPKGELEGYKIDKNQCLYLSYSNGRKQLVGRFTKHLTTPVESKPQIGKMGFQTYKWSESDIKAAHSGTSVSTTLPLKNNHQK